MKARWRLLVALSAAAVAAGAVPVLQSVAASGPGSGQLNERERVLELYIRSPVLVRAGERVQMPVRVVCATAVGAPCSSSVTLGVRDVPGRPWMLTTATSGPALAFDLTAAASRAIGSRDEAQVRFFVRATGPSGRTVSLSTQEKGAPLSFYAVADLPMIRAPAIPFGEVRRGETVLSLPWGSGSTRVGLQPGRESATLGPSSFDVDAGGRIYLADALQDRVAVFNRGRLVRQTPVQISARADIALTHGGAVFVLDGVGDAVRVWRIDPAGHLGPALSLGAGIPAQVRVQGESAMVDVLPQDAWFAVSGTGGGRLRAGGFTSGRPVAGGELLRVVMNDSLRLGIVSAGVVRDPVQIRFGHRLGEIALAESDGSGGYWAVVHVWRWHPSPADQFQVVHVSGGRIEDTFAVGDSRFADTPPLGRFRLGRDGALYQLMTFPDGVRIVRYDLGGQS